MSDGPLVYVVIVNWNGWRDTIECLESVFHIDYPRYRVIVCDNGSEDGSADRIKGWAQGKPLILLETGGNLGYAGGNNVGLRYALTHADCDYVWLLNNDTVVTPGALGSMVKRMSESPEIGICGASLLYYDRPDTVQALGGAEYNRWFGVPTHIGVFERFEEMRIPADEIERRMSYVVGASMLVSRAFVESVGLMTEDCFLCGEEIDWALRGRGRFRLAYAPEAVVYHKEGASLGSSSDPLAKSRAADYYSLRSRLTIARRHAPWMLPTVYLGLLGSAVNRARRGQWDRVGMILRSMLNLPCEH